MNPKIKKSALALLQANPTKKEIYATDDGNLFFDLHHAQDHNRKLKGAVTTITREAAKEDPPAEPPVQTNGKTKAAVKKSE